MNKAKIISELENMVVTRLFGRRPWLADRETCSAVHRKLVQMGLLECVGVEPYTYYRSSTLGKELGVDLFEVFMGIKWKCDVPFILAKHGLLNESEFGAILSCTSEANAEHLLSGYVKRAYFDYRKANKFLH
jgi:hypothetical protein